MALVKLGNKAVDSIVKLNEYGTSVDYIVVHQGLPGTMYDASCNGTWLLRKDIAEKRPWERNTDAKTNVLENSEILTYLNGDWLDRYDADVRAAIKQAKIPYRKNGGSDGTNQNGANGLACKIFPLSAYEIGYTTSLVPNIPVDGTKLDYFITGIETDANQKRIAHLDGVVADWLLRSPCTTTTAYNWLSASYGGIGAATCTSPQGVRPALILPSTFPVSDDGIVTSNTPPEIPSSITIPSQINGGSTITVEWGAASDAEGNLEGYKVERSLDGGTIWAQIYQGPARSITNLVPFGSGSVMYRVKAYDTEGLESGWKTSAQITVINNTAPTVPGFLTVPEQVQGGQTLAIAWGASTDGENNLAGYSLERQVDGGEWEVVYTGNTLSYTDTITKGWATVAYRVRAYDSNNAYSSYTVSPERTVNNNTAPAIICGSPSGSDLGEKDAGFMVSYSVSDVDGDEITVTEAIDGVTKRTFTATLDGSNSFNVTGEYFMKLLNGNHTLTITASDGKASTVHTLVFAKKVTGASITLETPMAADDQISICVLSVIGLIPADAEYKVEVTNNANDETPVWEDCTTAVKTGANYVFENKTAANGFAFNFRLTAERGPSGEGGYITSVQGGFQ